MTDDELHERLSRQEGEIAALQTMIEMTLIFLDREGLLRRQEIDAKIDSGLARLAARYSVDELDAPRQRAFIETFKSYRSDAPAKGPMLSVIQGGRE